MNRQTFLRHEYKLETVTFDKFVMMPLCAKHHNSSTEQVELHGHLCCHGRVDDSCDFVGGEYSQWIMPEISNGYKASLKKKVHRSV